MTSASTFKMDCEDSCEERMVSMFLPPTHPDFDKSQASAVAGKLNEIEEQFLDENHISAANTTEVELAKKFGTTTMNKESTTLPEYMHQTLSPMVEDSIHCSAPKMIGHMTTSLPFYMRPLAKLLTTLHANTVKVETAKSQTFVEKEALAMLHRQLFSMDDSFYAKYSARPDLCLGVVTSGGTIANNTALWIARNKCLPADGTFKGTDKEGMVAGLLHYGYKGAVVIGSAVMHYSMKKAADVLGIGTEGLVTCNFDKDYRVSVPEVRAAIIDCRARKLAILAVVGVCGGTETGSIDDLSALADLAKEFDVHFHVDAAWGGPVMFSSHRSLIAGMERADTVTLDGHKQLYTPMGCGMCFLRDPNQITAVEKTANYIIRKDSYDMGKFTMEGSRPAVSLFLHANLKIMGVSGYGALVDRSIRMVQYMVTALRKTGKFETALEPMTNILLYRYLPAGVRKARAAGQQLTPEQNQECDAANIAVQVAQKKAGATFVSRTTIWSPTQEVRVVVLRVVIANPRTTQADIDANLADQLEIAAALYEQKNFATSGDTIRTSISNDNLRGREISV